MLPNFFSINLPYGLAKNDKGEWIAFNREYMPLGFSDSKYKTEGHPNKGFKSDYPVYCKYKGLTERVLKILSENAGEYSLRYDEKEDINMIFLYNGTTNPLNHDNSKHNWQNYWTKLTMLSKLNTKA